VLSGEGMRNLDDKTLGTVLPRRKLHLQVVCHTAQMATLDSWIKEITGLRGVGKTVLLNEFMIRAIPLFNPT
jgi:hypothetical protein